jgi:Na+/proline symporter
MWMSISGGLLFFVLGISVYAFYRANPGELDPAMTSNSGILPYFILQQLPAGAAGLVIAAIFAASQSTVSSSLNSVSTAYVTDFHAKFFRRGNSDQENLFAARMVVVLLGTVGIVLAGVMAESNLSDIFEAFQTLIGLTAGALGGLFALGVFNKAANGTGAIVGAVAGLATVLSLKFGVWDADVSGLLYAFVGFMTCFLVGSFTSLLSGGREDSR